APLEATGPSWNASMRGLRSSGTLGDVNGDGIPELVVGIQNGGLRWFNGATVDITGYELPERPLVAPNPASTGEWIRIALPQPSRMAWMDVQGRLVQPLGLQQAGTASLPVPTAPGLYLLTTQPATGGMIRTVRVVVQ
ncbi:MAG: FG-GAP repeat protein, partial [Flavobacteriales bacterium]